MSSRAASRVFQGVEEQIATGQMKDGEKLDETSLAQRFHVSSTPVREALLQVSWFGARNPDTKTRLFCESTIISRDDRDV